MRDLSGLCAGHICRGGSLAAPLEEGVCTSMEPHPVERGACNSDVAQGALEAPGGSEPSVATACHAVLSAVLRGHWWA